MNDELKKVTILSQYTSIKNSYIARADNMTCLLYKQEPLRQDCIWKIAYFQYRQEIQHIEGGMRIDSRLAEKALDVWKKKEKVNLAGMSFER